MKKFGQWKIWRWAIWLALGLFGVSSVLMGRGHHTRVDESWRPVDVHRGNIDASILSTGYVLPETRLEIKPPVPGRIEKMLVQEGQKVRRGEVVALISSTERTALLDAARATNQSTKNLWPELLLPTPIISPLNGTVILRNAEPGQTLRAEDVALVVADRLTVKAQVDETDIAQIHVGQRATITLDAYGDMPIAARVHHIAYDARNVNNVTAYDVEALPIKVPPFMRSGMTANVVFQLSQKKEVLLLPFSAISQKNGHTTVTLQDPNDLQVKSVPIEIGISDGKNVEVVSGLNDGDTVLEPVLQFPDKAKGGSSFPFLFGGGSAPSNHD